MVQMMKTVDIGTCILGDGKLSLGVPLVIPSIEDCVRVTQDAVNHNPDLLEWRIDFFDKILEPAAVLAALERIFSVARDIPILATIRCPEEGGNVDVPLEYKRDLYIRLIRSGMIQAIDVELRDGARYIEILKAEAKNQSVRIIISYHNQSEIETEEKIVSIMRKIEKFGADVAKISVHPKSIMESVFCIETMRMAVKQHAHIPVIAIAGGEYGGFSRIFAEQMGSDLTFASVGTPSGSGQMGIEDLRKARKIFEEWRSL